MFAVPEALKPPGLAETVSVQAGRGANATELVVIASANPAVVACAVTVFASEPVAVTSSCVTMYSPVQVMLVPRTRLVLVHDRLTARVSLSVMPEMSIVPVFVRR